MSLGPAMDVALGLVFVFVLLSIVASAIQELIAAFLSTRGKMLEQMLRQMLAHDPVPAPQLGQVQAAAEAQPATLFQRVVSHPLIGSMATPNRPWWLPGFLADKPRPSYIPSPTFALALVEGLRADRDTGLAVQAQIEEGIAALPPGAIKRTLTAFISEARGDVDAFKGAVAHWYDSTMDRTAGAYKRYAQYMLLLIGLVLALLLNVDALRISTTLWRDPQVRVAVASVATEYLKGSAGVSPAKTPDQAIEQEQHAGNLFAALPAPMGWTVQNQPGLRAGTIALAILGWLLTGCAVSLGAPFWFDALQQISNLRGAGPKPPRADGN